MAASLRGAFFDSFALFAVGTDRLAQELSQGRAPAGENGQAEEAEALEGEVSREALGADRKLLVLLSNCAFVRGSIMPSLVDRCVGLLL